ncbi:MAG TPA: hypothetical protein VIQ81_08350 [Gammaproteobacteria bacterium]
MKIDEAVYTHEYLWRSSTYLLKNTVNSETDYRQLIPSLLLAFLAYEAFINFLGHVLYPELWKDEKKNFKGKGLEGKVEAIVQRLPNTFTWKKGEQPYQAIKALEEFRDMVSHGKVVTNKYASKQKEDGAHFCFQHDWDKFLTISAIKSNRENISKFVNELLVAARSVSDEPHLVFEAFEGSLAHGEGMSTNG